MLTEIRNYIRMGLNLTYLKIFRC